MSTAVLRSSAGLAEVLTARLSLPRDGAWTLHVELGEEAAPTGAVVLELGREGGDAIKFVGTVDHGDTWQGRQKLFVIGGGGAFGITTPAILNGREWLPGRAAIPVVDLVTELVEAAGEQLAPGVAASLAGLVLPRWMRLDGVTASRALSRLCRAAGLTWRVLDTGEVWIGVETWPAIADAAASFIEDRDGDLIVDRAAPDAATLRPGTEILGKRIHRVTYKVGEGAPRVELLGRSDREDFAAAVSAVQRPDPFSLFYEATVQAQRDDGTLDVVVDDLAIRELRAVPYRSFTGANEVIPDGSVVTLAFFGAREDRPFAFGQVQDPAATKAVARVGDATAGDWLSAALVGGAVVLSLSSVQSPGAVQITTEIIEGSAEVKIR